MRKIDLVVKVQPNIYMYIEKTYCTRIISTYLSSAPVEHLAPDTSPNNYIYSYHQVDLLNMLN